VTDQPSTLTTPARNGRTRIIDTFAAYVRIDVVEDLMFPATLAFRYVAVLVPVFLYLFQADFLDARTRYPGTLIGISVAAALQDGLTGVTARLQFAQERGTLETYLVEPVPWLLIPIAMNIWRSVMGMVTAGLMLTMGCLAGGVRIDVANLPAFVLVLVLGMAACNAVGLLAASFLVLFKRGDPIIVLYGLAASLLGGALFSINVLPGWLRWMSYLVPHAYVISAERELLDPASAGGGIPLGAALVSLVVFCVAGLSVGLNLFHRTLQYARRIGVLST
jgi:ABC-2 type transport system permease protein